MDTATLTSGKKLNQLCLQPSENDQVLSWFADMVIEEQRLFETDTAKTERMVHVLPLINVLRDDISHQDFTREELQEGAPEQTEGYWQVPRLLE